MMRTAMATRDAALTEGHVSELQSGTELHEPSFESEPGGAEKEKPNTKNEHEAAVLSRRELEEDLGYLLMGFDYGWIIRVEILSVQGEERLPSDGLLPPNRKGCCRDPKVQHGSHSIACLQEHDHLAQVHQVASLCTF